MQDKKLDILNVEVDTLKERDSALSHRVHRTERGSKKI
jgi:hypothetical protein